MELPIICYKLIYCVYGCSQASPGNVHVGRIPRSTCRGQVARIVDQSGNEVDWLGKPYSARLAIICEQAARALIEGPWRGEASHAPLSSTAGIVCPHQIPMWSARAGRWRFAVASCEDCGFFRGETIRGDLQRLRASQEWANYLAWVEDDEKEPEVVTMADINPVTAPSAEWYERVARAREAAETRARMTTVAYADSMLELARTLLLGSHGQGGSLLQAVKRPQNVMFASHLAHAATATRYTPLLPITRCYSTLAMGRCVCGMCAERAQIDADAASDYCSHGVGIWDNCQRCLEGHTPFGDDKSGDESGKEDAGARQKQPSDSEIECLHGRKAGVWCTACRASDRSYSSVASPPLTASDKPKRRRRRRPACKCKSCDKCERRKASEKRRRARQRERRKQENTRPKRHRSRRKRALPPCFAIAAEHEEKTNGLCYLNIFHPDARELAYEILGAWPTKWEVAKVMEGFADSLLPFYVSQRGRSVHVVPARTISGADEGLRRWFSVPGSVRVGGEFETLLPAAMLCVLWYLYFLVRIFLGMLSDDAYAAFIEKERTPLRKKIKGGCWSFIKMGMDVQDALAYADDSATIVELMEADDAFRLEREINQYLDEKQGWFLTFLDRLCGANRGLVCTVEEVGDNGWLDTESMRLMLWRKGGKLRILKLDDCHYHVVAPGEVCPGSRSVTVRNLPEGWYGASVADVIAAISAAGPGIQVAGPFVSHFDTLQRLCFEEAPYMIRKKYHAAMTHYGVTFLEENGIAHPHGANAALRRRMLKRIAASIPAGSRVSVISIKPKDLMWFASNLGGGKSFSKSKQKSQIIELCNPRLNGRDRVRYGPGKSGILPESVKGDIAVIDGSLQYLEPQQIARLFANSPNLKMIHSTGYIPTETLRRAPSRSSLYTLAYVGDDVHIGLEGDMDNAYCQPVSAAHWMTLKGMRVRVQTAAAVEPVIDPLRLPVALKAAVRATAASELTLPIAWNQTTPALYTLAVTSIVWLTCTAIGFIIAWAATNRAYSICMYAASSVSAAVYLACLCFCFVCISDFGFSKALYASGALNRDMVLVSFDYDVFMENMRTKRRVEKFEEMNIAVTLEETTSMHRWFCFSRSDIGLEYEPSSRTAGLEEYHELVIKHDGATRVARLPRATFDAVVGYGAILHEGQSTDCAAKIRNFERDAPLHTDPRDLTLIGKYLNAVERNQRMSVISLTPDTGFSYLRARLRTHGDILEPFLRVVQYAAVVWYIYSWYAMFLHVPWQNPLHYHLTPTGHDFVERNFGWIHLNFTKLGFRQVVHDGRVLDREFGPMFSPVLNFTLSHLSLLAKPYGIVTPTNEVYELKTTLDLISDWYYVDWQGRFVMVVNFLGNFWPTPQRIAASIVKFVAVSARFYVKGDEAMAAARAVRNFRESKPKFDTVTTRVEGVTVRPNAKTLYAPLDELPDSFFEEVAEAIRKGESGVEKGPIASTVIELDDASWWDWVDEQWVQEFDRVRLKVPSARVPIVPTVTDNSCGLQALCEQLDLPIHELDAVAQHMLGPRYASTFREGGLFIDDVIAIGAVLGKTVAVWQSAGVRTGGSGPLIHVTYTPGHFTSGPLPIQSQRAVVVPVPSEDFRGWREALLAFESADGMRVPTTAFKGYQPNYERAKTLARELKAGHTGLYAEIMRDPELNKTKFAQNYDLAVDIVLRSKMAGKHVAMTYVAGFAGCRKSSTLQDFLRSRDMTSDDVIVVSPTTDLREDWRVKLQKPKREEGRITTFEKAIGKSARTVVIDEITRYPPGYLQLLIATNPTIETLVLLGDPCQGLSHEPDSPVLEAMCDEGLFYLTFADYYCDWTFRLPKLIAGRLGVRTFSSVQGFIDKSWANVTTLVASRAEVEKSTSLDTEVLTFNSSQGLTKPAVNLLLDRDAVLLSGPHHIIVALTRATQGLHVKYDYGEIADDSLWKALESDVKYADFFPDVFGGNGLSRVTDPFRGGKSSHDRKQQQIRSNVRHDRARNFKLTGSQPTFDAKASIAAIDAKEPTHSYQERVGPNIKSYIDAPEWRREQQMKERPMWSGRKDELPKGVAYSAGHRGTLAALPALDTEKLEVMVGNESTHTHHQGTMASQPVANGFAHYGATDEAAKRLTFNTRTAPGTLASNKAEYTNGERLGTELWVKYRQRALTRPFQDIDVEQVVREVFERVVFKKPAAQIKNKEFRQDADIAMSTVTTYVKAGAKVTAEKWGKAPKGAQLVLTYNELYRVMGGIMVRMVEMRERSQLSDSILDIRGKSIDDISQWSREHVRGTAMCTDYTKWDQAVRGPACQFQRLRALHYGVSPEMFDAYMRPKLAKTARGRVLRLAMDSGEPGTFDWNTSYNRAVLIKLTDWHERRNWMVAAGDDGAIGTRHRLTASDFSFLKAISLEVKVFYEESPRFCGMILTDEGAFYDPKDMVMKLRRAQELKIQDDTNINYGLMLRTTMAHKEFIITRCDTETFEALTECEGLMLNDFGELGARVFRYGTKHIGRLTRRQNAQLKSLAQRFVLVNYRGLFRYDF
uniref:RNA-dependent RNA polymerase n=1 Tax=Rhizoctonia cerealis tymo-like virus TaxID=3068672 RepID=A0AA51BS93_9VIRU|nr:MAG: RNA-dependent RNA polymerase [Rhizoctonia cerealis tymo-like virus]